MFRGKTIAAFAAAFSVTMMACIGYGADHLDAPNLRQIGPADKQPGSADLNDLYVFQSPSNPDNSVLIMTVNPFAGVTNPFGTTSPTSFSSDVTYSFNVDNDGDALADITYDATFTPTSRGAKQTQTVHVKRNGTNYANGRTERALTTRTGGELQAGLFEDPFFFDFAGFLDGLQFTGDDTFAGANVSALVLEVPSSEITAEDSIVGVWATTNQGGSQVDRVGRPAINTVLIPSDRKQTFNESQPVNDFTAFGTDVNAAITSLSDTSNAGELTPILLPDILTFDTSNATGFLNGRRLDDDVIDIALQALTDNPAATDLVNGNDVAFHEFFPYLAAANDSSINTVPEPSSSVLALLGTIGSLACLRRWRR